MIAFLKWFIAILIILWIIGLVIDIIGALIHILLVVAVIAGIYYFFVNRRSSTAP